VVLFDRSFSADPGSYWGVQAEAPDGTSRRWTARGQCSVMQPPGHATSPEVERSARRWRSRLLGDRLLHRRAFPMLGVRPARRGVVQLHHKTAAS
jgi:hypothetical protein